MLVLTRKRSEKIRIGDNIVIKVIKAGRNTVKIGIEAPSDVRVLREELLDGRSVSLECDTPGSEEATVIEEEVEEPCRVAAARSLAAAAG